MTTAQQGEAPIHPIHKEERDADSSFRQANLGWEGHVHFPTDVPLWRRVLESWPELRTGLAYGLVFGAGVLLGSAVTTFVGTKNQKTQR
ncbi:MAG: hypothetical protein MRJ96_00410 [Nitrospirales bacterium]|nr:hypothetical protein [Nitrospira sp.]MDR4499901.1 hypothetical protein [Nitrospirales bacterium]